jgi:hypothetical protein
VSDPTALPSFPPPSDEHPLRGRVLDVLIDAGLAPNVDDDGDVAVLVQNQKIFVRCVDGAMPMMRIFGQWRVGQSVTADELTKLRAAGDVTARTNLVKVTVHDDVLLVAVDLVVPEQTPLAQLMQGAFVGVLSAVKAWHLAAGGSPEEGGPPEEEGQPDGG